MMEYIPGDIHEELQKEHFFLVNHDFNWTNCVRKRFSEMRDSKDWDETETLGIKAGDIIVVRFFRYSPVSNSYTYLERVIYSNGDEIEYKTESIISLALIEKNLYPGKIENKSWLLNDMTKSFERDKKIESILC